MTFNQSSIPAVQIAIMYLLITSVYYYKLFKARRDHTVGDLLGILFPQAGTCCRHGAKSVPMWSCTPCLPAACRPWNCRACRHLPTASCSHPPPSLASSALGSSETSSSEPLTGLWQSRT